MSLLSRLAVQAARAYGILSSADKTKVVADYLVVAGGGGAGDDLGGAGGAGGFRTSAGTSGGGASAEPSITLSTLNTYSILVGAGGAGATSGGATGTNGGNSSISGTGLTTITSTGGGGGAGDGGGSGVGTPNSGGSGGGAASGSGRSGAVGTANQGFAGGSNPAGTYYGASAGGGGAGAAGTGRSGSSATGGNGGNGVQSSISGTATYYAGGGSGGTGTSGTSGTPGLGGGGQGMTYSGSTVKGGDGTTNTGGGGGGGTSAGGDGGSGGSGIVIISYTSATPKFVGGTITTSGGKQIHTFTSSGTLSPITPITASYLVVAGGGGGGAGGGGAGGLLTSSTTLYSGASYVVTVGAGGTAGQNTSAGANGSNSVVSGTGLTTLTATGGGRGGYFSGVAGASGGSGGGGGGADAGGTAGTGGAGTSGQGNNGGTGAVQTTTNGGGGGGGAGAAGGNATAGSNGGAGGVGVSSSISGTATYYAGGGSGGCSVATAGGTGGGGAGGAASSVGSPGTPNTGGGGGGAGNTSGPVNAGSGGSGIVIISYAGSQVFNGGLVTTSGGNTIHTFTSTGALTPLTNNLNNSLRFRRSASAYLSRTPTVAGDRQKMTYSLWIKRGFVGSLTSDDYCPISAYTDASNGAVIYFNSSNSQSLDVFLKVAGTNYAVTTSQRFADPAAWYHIVVAIDTTQATAANRTKIYVNGNQVTSFIAASYVPQNSNLAFNNNVAQYIGTQYASSSYFDGYMADINFIDGQQLEPYYFGNNDANGVWKPIQYKGTYGTNGFYLTFGNTTSTTTLGYDSSPNGNNWTCNNISLTAGTTYDAMTDVPTNTSATVANYAVWNAISVGVDATLSSGNLNIAYGTASTRTGTAATMGMSSGKYYWEISTVTQSGVFEPLIGIVNTTLNSSTTSGIGIYVGYTANGWGYDAADGNKYTNGTGSAYGATWTSSDVIGVAFDADNGTLTFYKNNVSQGTAFTGLTSGPYFPAISDGSTAGTFTMSANFGQRPFTYTPPTGYVALNTYNLPTPTILQGNKYMDATLYTGNGSTQVVVNNAQFKPDLVWAKSRSNAVNHNLFDSVRGVYKGLISNDTAAEINDTASLTAFNSNGFTLGPSNITLAPNYPGYTYVGWQWQAGQGSTSSNTSGSITSTVSVNTTAGFSVVTYTGTGSTKTFGHGLGVTPAMFIVKSRSQTGENWVTWHKSFSNTAQGNMALNTTDAVSNSASVWGNTAPTSTLITVGNAAVNNNTSTYVCYAWAEIAGFSKFGSYTGNGSADGLFVYLGFRPKFIMIKNTTTAGYNWTILDTSRDTYNYSHYELYPNTSGAEVNASSSYTEDILSNGFKIRQTDATWNASGSTYVYAAFAEHPFKNANAR